MNVNVGHSIKGNILPGSTVHKWVELLTVRSKWEINGKVQSLQTYLPGHKLYCFVHLQIHKTVIDQIELQQSKLSLFGNLVPNEHWLSLGAGIVLKWLCAHFHPYIYQPIVPEEDFHISKSFFSQSSYN